jgi:hypothetical protein
LSQQLREHWRDLASFVGRIDRTGVELLLQRRAGHVLGHRHAACRRDDDTLRERLRVGVTHHLDQGSQVTVLDALRCFERAQAAGVGRDRDHAATGVIFSGKPAPWPLAGAKQARESEASGER